MVQEAYDTHPAIRGARNRGLHLRVNLRKGRRSICRGLEARAKTKEFARLTVVAKSLRDGRQYQKLAEMYWALALGEEPEPAKPLKRTSKGAGHDHVSHRVSQTFGAEVGTLHRPESHRHRHRAPTTRSHRRR